MTRKQKQFQRLLKNQKNVRFNDFTTILEAFGFVLDRTRGSHRVYKHPNVDDALLVVLPNKNNQAMPYQIKQFLGLVEEHNLQMAGSEEENPDED